MNGRETFEDILLILLMILGTGLFIWGAGSTGALIIYRVLSTLTGFILLALTSYLAYSLAICDIKREEGNRMVK